MEFTASCICHASRKLQKQQKSDSSSTITPLVFKNPTGYPLSNFSKKQSNHINLTQRIFMLRSFCFSVSPFPQGLVVWGPCWGLVRRGGLVAGLHGLWSKTMCDGAEPWAPLASLSFNFLLWPGMHTSGCPSLAPSQSWLLTSNQPLFKLEVSVSSTCDYMLQVLLLTALTPLIPPSPYLKLNLDIFRH